MANFNDLRTFHEVLEEVYEIWIGSKLHIVEDEGLIWSCQLDD